MLVDVQWTSSVIGDMIAVANGNLAGVHRLQQGIYEIGHFSFDQMIQAENEWPELGDEFNAFGVCDDPQQVLDKCPQLQDAGRKFVVSVTPVSKANQSADGGRGSVERGRKGGGMKPVNGWAMVETLGGASTLLLPAMRTRTECIDDW